MAAHALLWSPEGSLGESASKVARALARRQLARWGKTGARLHREDDPEALHDFRVELRRLRSVLRVFRPQLEGLISGKARRRLRRLADATNESRNLEVERAWIEQQLHHLTPAERAGAEQALARLAERQEAVEHRVRQHIEKLFASMEGKLELALADPQEGHGESARGRSAGAIIRRALRRGATELERQLAATHTPADWEPAHQARITAKRLRYLLEPFEAELPGGPKVLEELRVLQDVLGTLHDAHVMAEELREQLGAAAAERARRVGDAVLGWDAIKPEQYAADTSSEVGILALMRRLRGEGESAFAKLRAEWLEGRATPLVVELGLLGRPRKIARTSRSAGSRYCSEAAEGLRANAE